MLAMANTKNVIDIILVDFLESRTKFWWFGCPTFLQKLIDQKKQRHFLKLCKSDFLLKS